MQIQRAGTRPALKFELKVDAYIKSSNTETGLAEALAAAGTTTETTTTSSNEAVALVTAWREQHSDRNTFR